MSASGSVVAEARHFPYGEERWSSGTLPTEYRFTGQRNHSYIRLVRMGERLYDAYVGRFVSPDTILPDLANPQSCWRQNCLIDGWPD